MSARELYFFAVGTQKTGKTTNARKFFALNGRNLILPPNRFDTTWDDVEELDWRRIFSDSTGLPDMEAPFVFQSRKELKNKMRFMYALAQELHTFEGNRKLYIDSDSRYIYEIICNNDYGLKNAGLFHDDFRNYIIGANPPAYTTNLVTNRRARMLDLGYMCHSFKDISGQFLKLNPGIILHYTTVDLTKANMSESLYRFLLPIKKEVDAIAQKGLMIDPDLKSPEALKLYTHHRMLTTAEIARANQ